MRTNDLTSVQKVNWRNIPIKLIDHRPGGKVSNLWFVGAFMLYHLEAYPKISESTPLRYEDRSAGFTTQ